jgi:hypothetical protein
MKETNKTKIRISRRKVVLWLTGIMITVVGGIIYLVLKAIHDFWVHSSKSMKTVIVIVFICFLIGLGHSQNEDDALADKKEDKDDDLWL